MLSMKCGNSAKRKFKKFAAFSLPTPYLISPHNWPANSITNSRAGDRLRTNGWERKYVESEMCRPGQVDYAIAV